MCWRMSFIKLLDEIRKMLNITIALVDFCCVKKLKFKGVWREREGSKCPKKLMENNAK